MGMKVCKHVRLTKKNDKGEFEIGTKGEGQITIRTKVVVDESSVKESEDNYKNTGLLYVVDVKATAERDELVAKELEESRGSNVEAKIVTDEFGSDGFNAAGYNKDGYDKHGYNKDGFGVDGFNKDGFDVDGFNKEGYDAKGFNKEGYNKDGFDSKGKAKPADKL